MYSSKENGTNLFVKNLDSAVEDQRLRSAFSVHGNITSVKVMRNDDGSSKGFGFVCFSNSLEAGRAICEMNGRIFFGKPLYVGVAQRKQERVKILQAQYSKAHEPVPLAPNAPLPIGIDYLQRRIVKACRFPTDPVDYEEAVLDNKRTLIDRMGIAFLYPEIADQIEGIMIKLDIAELFNILSNADLLKKKIHAVANTVQANRK